MRIPTACLLGLLALPAAAGELPDAIAASDDVLVATVHAQGAQIYECKADPAGQLAWHFREPVATLFSDGRTVGRHYAGPTWELSDGSVVRGKVAGRAPGASAQDIPLLKLAVDARPRTGRLAAVAIIQRIYTRGGVADGADPAGPLVAGPQRVLGVAEREVRHVAGVELDVGAADADPLDVDDELARRGHRVGHVLHLRGARCGEGDRLGHRAAQHDPDPVERAAHRGW